jgi:putative membrane-bound dehydrogenase-like protein
MKSILLIPILMFTAVSAAPVSIFDGKTLDGWEIRKGEEKWWRVQDGMITGGSLEEVVPKNTFLTHHQRHANFELRLKLRLVKGSGFMNSGVQIRSIRVPDNHEMSGYQVDAGIGWWGKIYDESRRNKVIAEPVDPAAVAAVVRDWDWNDYRIRCEGPRIRSWINGVPALDYTEPDPKIPLEGLIGVQAHSGGKFLVQFKDITLEELPPTPGAPAWPTGDERSPENEKASFQLPDGYEIELVASEHEGVGKPITVAWDHSGRMWTMTALEYPVDANENAAAAEALFEKGGKDQVLVFDEPWKPGPQKPRVFAEGLAIPLGILPWKNGVFVQHGHEIRHYEDLDNDGRADRHTVVLTGFGVQDSHLFPHQFERTPGGWFYLAQGLFNYSKVVRPEAAAFADGSTEKPFNQCKLARARLDGSDFEALTAGPNNIWGFAIARDGNEYLQEANDLGHPVSEFIVGTHYPTGSKEKLRPYAPVLPPSTPGQPMGGTGLSGIALADDEGSVFAAKWPGEKVFYIANPITRKIQIVTRGQDAAGIPVTTKREDFLLSSDDWFRPVAIHFGPDGCLYVVDWYNKIISHNEVPRTHPDRDKSRGRIWRIKPTGAKPAAAPDLTKLPPSKLLEMLGHPNSRIARMAWAEIGDRRDAGMLPTLRALAADTSQANAKRLGALWAMQEMGSLDAATLAVLANDNDSNIRREAVEAAGDFALGETEFLALFKPGETDFQVVCAMANALRRNRAATAAMAGRVARLADLPQAGNERAAYERDFIRYLVRWALECHPDATTRLLAGDAGLTQETRALAALALPPAQAAAFLLRELPSMDRPIGPEEAALLGSQLDQAEVRKEFTRLLNDSSSRVGLLKSLLRLDPVTSQNQALRETVGKTAESMIAQDPSSLPLVVELARHFRIKSLAPAVASQAKVESDPTSLAGLLRTLNEIQSADLELSTRHLDHGDPAVAREALIGFATAGGPAAVSQISSRWNSMPGVLRPLALNGMLSNKSSAEAFSARAALGEFSGFDPSTIERLASILGKDHPSVQGILKQVRGLLEPVIRLPDGKNAVIASGIDLNGPFTVETWILLDNTIDNRDSLLGSRAPGMDINFYAGLLRFYAGRDIVIADRPVKAGTWTHCAVTRDADGKVSLFLDGDAAGVSSVSFTAPLKSLDLGKANQQGGTGARFCEFRIWDRAKNADEIRNDYRTRLTGSVAGLIHRFSGDSTDLPFQGGAAIEWSADFPELITPEAAGALAGKFDRFRKAAQSNGDPAAGRSLFQATCMICHQVAGEGVAIGPDLSGAGAMGLESLLRNILTPNAQLESGYYRHDLTLADGSFASGFMASETAETYILRQIGADERAIPRSSVKAHAVSKRSLMPEGLIDGFSDKQIADLFSYLNGLK